MFLAQESRKTPTGGMRLPQLELPEQHPGDGVQRSSPSPGKVPRSSTSWQICSPFPALFSVGKKSFFFPQALALGWVHGLAVMAPSAHLGVPGYVSLTLGSGSRLPLPAKAYLRKQQVLAQVLGFLPPPWEEAWMEFLASGFSSLAGTGI